MQARRLSATALAIGLAMGAATASLGAELGGQIARLAPYLQRVKALATAWQPDAKFTKLTIEAEADGSIVKANVVSMDNLKGRMILAYFHSASAAKRKIFMLDGGADEWIDYVEEDAPAAEGVPVIPGDALEWQDVVKQAGERVVGAFDNGAQAECSGVLVGTWNPTRNAHGSEWLVFSYLQDPDDDVIASDFALVRGPSTEGVERAVAISERADEQQPNEFSLLAGAAGSLQTVTDLSVIGRLPAAGGAVDVQASRDGRHWMYVADGASDTSGGYMGKGEESLRVVIDGVASGPFRRIGRIHESSEGGHLAYAGKRGGQWHVVVDGSEHLIGDPEYDGNLGWRELSPVWFSNDGEHWAVALTQPRKTEEDGWYLEDALYVDGKPTSTVLRRAPGKDATEEEQQAAYNRVGFVAVKFAPHGTPWAAVHRGVHGTRIVAAGLPPLPAAVSIPAVGLRYTAEGTLLWTSFDGENTTFWRDASAAGQVEGNAALHGVSPDGTRVALHIISDDGDRIDVLGEGATVTFGPGETIEEFLFSPDSKHCAAVEWGDDDMRLFIDGKAVRSAESIVSTQFKKEGTIVYGVQDPDKLGTLVVGDLETPTPFSELDEVHVTDAGTIALWGTAAEPADKPQQILVVNDAVVETAAELNNVTFFSDGTAVYEAQFEADGARVPCFRGVAQPQAPVMGVDAGRAVVGGSAIVVDGPDSAHYVAVLTDGRVAQASVHPRLDRPAGQ